MCPTLAFHPLTLYPMNRDAPNSCRETKALRLLWATNHRDANGSAAKLTRGPTVGDIQVDMPLSNQGTSVENTVRPVVRGRAGDANNGAKR